MSDTTEAFDTALAAGGLVLVDVYTPRCQICRRVHPMVDAVATQFRGRLTALRIDAEAEPDLARRLEIRGVPHLLLLKGGEVVERHAGFLTASAIRGWVTRHLD